MPVMYSGLADREAGWRQAQFHDGDGKRKRAVVPIGPENIARIDLVIERHFVSCFRVVTLRVSGSSH